MTEKSLLFLVLILIGQKAFAQCVPVNFNISVTECANASIPIENFEEAGYPFEWDFCSKDLENTPSGTLLFRNLNWDGVTGLKLIQSDLDWIGFVVSGANNKIFRLDFGLDLENPNPIVTDLGNVGLTLNKPEAIDIINVDGNWFGLIINFNESSVIRLEFGSSLVNIPNATKIVIEPVHGVSLGSSIKIVSSSEGIFGFFANRGGSRIVRMNFGTSILNAPVIDQLTTPGVASPRGLSIVRGCDKWSIFFLSTTGNKIHRLDFSQLDQAPIYSTLTTTGDGLSGIISIETRIDFGNYYLIISSSSGTLFKVLIGSTLENNNAVVTNLSNLGLFPNFTAFDLQAVNGYFFGYLIGNNKYLYNLQFKTNCPIEDPFVEGEKVTDIKYTGSGVFGISLKSLQPNGLVVCKTSEITITTLVPPDITFTSQNICANNDVNFTSENISGDITDYNWDFDDTNTSMAQDPIHQFAAAGDYDVKLQVTASNGCNNLASETVTIYNEPVANFELPSASPICTNQEYIFDNTTSFDAGSNPTWQWEVNGTPTSTVEDLTYQIPTATMQDIKLITTIPGCSSEVTKTINTVEDGPFADFIYANDCEDKSITFTNTTVGAVIGYSWDFGDGNSSGITDGTNTFDDFGTYDVTLEATNAAGCINTSVQEITIYSKPQPDFSLDLPPFSCNGSPSQFNDLTPNPVDSNLDSWAWSFGDSQNGTSTIKNPQYVYDDAGQYDVNLDVTTNFGCTASVQKMVMISQTPDANFTFNAACVNQATSFVPQSTQGTDSWQWKVGVSTYNQQNPTHVFSIDSNYNVQLTANGSNGCVGVASQTVNVPEPSTVDFSFENNCTNQDTEFTDLTLQGSDPVSSRFWQFGTIGSSSGGTPLFTFPTAESYPTKLTVTNESGCSYSTTKIVNITPSPVVAFTATPQTGTPPLTVQLNNTSSNSVSQLWSASDPSSTTSTEKTASFTFDTLGEYVVDLTIQDESGCSSVTSKIISVIIPSLDIELTNLSLMPSATGESNILLTLTNKSNFPVNNIKALVDIAGEALVSETLTATIQPGEVYSQILSSGIIGAKNGTTYLCVELVVDGDADTTNNKQCLNNDVATIVKAPYPNPGSENLNLEWISSVSGNAEIHIFDPTGRKVYEDLHTDSEPGLNQTTISVSLLNPGMYYVFFVSEGVRRSFPFVIRR